MCLPAVLRLRWTRATAAAVETGARTVTLPELVLLALAVQVEVDKLLAGDGLVELVPGARGSLPAIRSLLEGDLSNDAHFKRPAPPKLAQLMAGAKERMAAATKIWPDCTPRKMMAAEGEAEQKAARRLRRTAVEVSLAAHAIWGQSLTAEREARVAAKAPADTSPRTLQSLRGHVTRDLLVQLQQRLGTGGK